MTETGWFGDFDVDDAVDTEPAAPEQVARRLHRYRRYLGQLAGDDPGDFDDLSVPAQSRAHAVAEAIVEWIHDHPTDARRFAEAIHEIHRARNGVAQRWDELADDLRDVGEAIALAVMAWLVRQGAWR